MCAFASLSLIVRELNAQAALTSRGTPRLGIQHPRQDAADRRRSSVVIPVKLKLFWEDLINDH